MFTLAFVKSLAYLTIQPLGSYRDNVIVAIQISIP